MSWDYVIVGAGSAGCVLAERLSADGRHRVLLIEAGPRDWSPYIHVPAGGAKRSGVGWVFQGEADPSRAGMKGLWTGGKVLGGGSSINGMAWVRGNRADFDEWAKLGCAGWDFKSVLPYFMRAESWEGGENAYRGGRGPTRVGRQRVPHRLTDAFVAAAQRCGHGLNPDYNGEWQEGVSYGQVNQRRGFRHSTARAYLGRARWRRNLDIFTQAFVTRVVFEGRRAVGVELERGGRTVVAAAAKEVILSAGVLGSPKLLMLSGIGPAEHLREHGISMVVDSPGVGRNLRDHLFFRMVWSAKVTTLNMELTPKGILKHGADFLVRGRGAAAAGIFHAMLFSRLRAESRYPDIFASFAPLAMEPARPSGKPTAPGTIAPPRMQPMRTNAVSAYVGVLHPRAVGEVRLRSGRPQDPPLIRYQVLAHEEDIRALSAGVHMLLKICEADPLRQLLGDRLIPGPEVQTDEQWKAFYRRASSNGQHAVGTCRMGGEDDDMAVVDPELRVRGVEGLRVVDASVMPRVTSGHTNAPIIMVAEKASDLILRTAT